MEMPLLCGESGWSPFSVLFTGTDWVGILASSRLLGHRWGDRHTQKMGVPWPPSSYYRDGARLWGGGGTRSRRKAETTGEKTMASNTGQVTADGGAGRPPFPTRTNSMDSIRRSRNPFCFLPFSFLPTGRETKEGVASGSLLTHYLDASHGVATEWVSTANTRSPKEVKCRYSRATLISSRKCHFKRETF